MQLLHRMFQMALVAIIFASGFACATEADAAKSVIISNAWVRATNPGQSVGAAYMTLTAKQDMTLMHIESDVTASVEIHSMSMTNGVMKMRMLENLPLVANKPYALTPGGFHIMLFDLKKPLSAGEKVNLTLHFKNKLTRFKQSILVPVQSIEDTTVEHQH